MSKKKSVSTLTPSQEKAAKAIREGHNVFLTGKAGTGKTYLARQIIADARRHGRNVLVCAPTGIAAVNAGGVTMHKALRIFTGIQSQKPTLPDSALVAAAAAADLVVIDEISMCRLDTFNTAMLTLAALANETGRAKQILAVGDFHQLPPVVTSKESAAYRKLWEGIWPFEGRTWHAMGMKTLELQENMRQQDRHLTEILDNIRIGIPDLYWLNKAADHDADPQAVTICTTNAAASRINEEAMSALGGKAMAFCARIEGEVSQEDMNVPEIVRVKKGARMIVMVNDPEGRFVNGDTGTVIDILPNEGRVLLALDKGKEVAIGPHVWTVWDYKTGTVSAKRRRGLKTVTEEKEVIERVEAGCYTQLPLKPAWAVTVHKSQGQTYDKVNIRAADRWFSPGQLYVALSRCRTLEGMHILGTIPESAVKADPLVLKFMAGKYKPYGSSLL